MGRPIYNFMGKVTRVAVHPGPRTRRPSPLHRPAIAEKAIVELRSDDPFDHALEITSPRERAVLVRERARPTVRVPSKLLRSVAVKPGHAALTLMRVDSSSKAKASVIALRAVFDGL